MNKVISAAYVVEILRRGGIGVLPTDTIYGVVGSALRPKTVERIYRLRRRNQKKPLLVLISSKFDVRKFGVRLDRRTSNILNKLWPGKVTVILPTSSKLEAKSLWYLHRGTYTVAFRLPATSSLRTLLKKTGPLVAPSANREGKPPARTVAQAKKYFGSRVDFYTGGRCGKLPSTLIRIERGRPVVLRQGAVRVK